MQDNQNRQRLPTTELIKMRVPPSSVLLICRGVEDARQPNYRSHEFNKIVHVRGRRT